MGNVAASSPAGLTSSVADLATLALDPVGWSVEKAHALGVDPAEAITRLKAREVIGKNDEPKGGPKTDRLRSALGLIGAKLSPGMSEQQAQAWAAAMILALGDLPLAFSIRGAEDALHVPMTFINEVEKVIREKAEQARLRHVTALHRLRMFERQVRSASDPSLPPPPPKEYTQDEVNAMSPTLRRMGLGCGAITQEQVDAARVANNEKDEDDGR